MARQNERKMKLYMEAGLAVLLVLTIALASVSGRLSSQAHEKDKNKQEAAVQGEAEVYEKNKGNDQEKNEGKTTLKIQREMLKNHRKRSLTDSIRLWETAA